MTISFSEATGGPVPKIEIEINLTSGGGLPTTDDRRDIYIMGERLDAVGTSTDNEVRSTPFADAAEAEVWFGSTASTGGMSTGAYQAHQAYKYRNGDTGKAKCAVYGIALPEPTGANQTITLTYTTTATSSGTWTHSLWGHSWNVVVATGDDVTAQALASKTAFNALRGGQRPPFNATCALGVLTLTAVNAGAHYTGAYYETVTDADCGTSAAWAVATAGTGTHATNMTTVLGNVGNVALRQLVPAFADDASCEELIDQINDNSNATAMLGSRLILANCDTATNLVSYAAALDSNDTQRVVCGGINGTNSHPMGIAARFAALRASETHLARSLNNIQLPDIDLPSVSDQWTAAELEVLIEAGITPLYVPAGGKAVAVCRAVSLRTDLGIIDDARMDVLDYCRDYWAGLITANLSRASIVSDDAVVPPVSHITRPKAVRSLLRGGADALEQIGYLTNVAEHWAQVVTELSGGTLSMSIPTEMVPQLHNTMIRIDSAVG